MNARTFQFNKEGQFRVKKSTQRKLRNRKGRIEHRLRDISWSAQEEPMFGTTNVLYDMSDRVKGFAAGGIAAILEMAKSTGLVEEIDRRLHLLKVHLPYHESDHVLNIALNFLAGGRCLEDLELLRNDEVYLDAIGAQRIPDPTTAGDFCRRFKPHHVEALMDVMNEVRLRVWKTQPASFFEEAVIEADGSLVESGGERKAGMDFSFKGTYGYHPLVVSLANTQEPLYLVNRSGNRPSQEGAARIGPHRRCIRSPWCPTTPLGILKPMYGPGTSFTEVRGHPLHMEDALDGYQPYETASAVLSRVHERPMVDE
jgi:hypothetical protein